MMTKSRSGIKSRFIAMTIAALAAVAVQGCTSRGVTRDPIVKSLWAEASFQDGLKAEAKGNTRAAESRYRSALRQDPEHAPTLKRLAEIHTARREFAQALTLWKRNVEASGRTADAWNDLGFCYDLAGLPDPAEAAYLHGVAADPTHTRCRANYGLYLARHGRSNEALLQFRAAMTPADAHYNLAVILEGNGERQAARAEYRKALDLDPGFGPARTRLAAIE